MARRTTEASELEVAAFARKAVEEVARSDDPGAAAVRVLQACPDARFQRGVLETAALSANEASTPIVRAGLQSGQPVVARIAAEQLAYLSEDPDAFDLAGLCMQSDDAMVRRRGVDALENFSDPRAVAFLAPALTDKEDVVRRAATAVFGLIVGTHHHGLLPAILQALGDPESDLVRAIVRSKDDQVRRQAAQSLAFARSDAVLPTLELMAKDEDDEVRQETVLCLAAIGSAKSVELDGHDADRRELPRLLDRHRHAGRPARRGVQRVPDPARPRPRPPAGRGAAAGRPDARPLQPPGSRAAAGEGVRGQRLRGCAPRRRDAAPHRRGEGPWVALRRDR